MLGLNWLKKDSLRILNHRLSAGGSGGIATFALVFNLHLLKYMPTVASRVHPKVCLCYPNIQQGILKHSNLNPSKINSITRSWLNQKMHLNGKLSMHLRKLQHSNPWWIPSTFSSNWALSIWFNIQIHCWCVLIDVNYM